MNSDLTRRALLALILLVLVTGAPSLLATEEKQKDAAQANEQATATQKEEARDDDQEGRLYLPSDDAMADLAATLAEAEAQNKLALVILGANWCHDSRGLAARLQVEPLKSLVNTHYETLYVDVGDLSKGRDVIQSLGVPLFYATPTVLIVDPISRKLVNAGNRHIWARADSVSMEDSVSYFEEIANIDLATLPDEDSYTEEQAQLMNDIDEFELAQAQRLSDAYIITGAMIGGTFDREVWDEVASFRFQLATDVDDLRAEVARRVANGETDIVLTYPQYPDWTWDGDTKPGDEQ